MKGYKYMKDVNYDENKSFRGQFYKLTKLTYKLPLKKNGFNAFIRENYKSIVGWGSFLISVIMFTLFFIYQRKDYESIPVTGIVIAKNEGYRTSYRSTRVMSEFHMVVKPLDTAKYKTFDMTTNFLTYSTHSVGSTVTFERPKGDALIGYKAHKIGLLLLFGILFFIPPFILGSNYIVDKGLNLR